MKKINGRIHYFGRWAKMVNGKLERVPGDGWREALEAYKAVADDLHAGREPRVVGDALTVVELCDRFLVAKGRKVEAGEMAGRTLAEYKETTDMVVAMFGRVRPVADLRPEDFEKLRAKMAKRWGPLRLANGITRAKSVFRYALESGLLDRPVRFGPEFKKPDKAVLRRHRAQAGEKMIEAADLRRLIEAAGVPLRAMILLGLNAGLGNIDCASLPLSAVNLDAGWLDFPRPKTGIGRRCPLWPETIEALRKSLTARPEPADQAAAPLVFLTVRRTGWIHFTPKGGRIDNVTIQFTLLLKRLGLWRPRIGFYTLRHVFRTVADAARDPVAIDLIMGHSDPSMASHYRERIDDDRLQAVAAHVHEWLFGDGAGDRQGDGEEQPDTDTTDETPPRDEGDARPALRLFAG
jgi:integrase